MIINFMSDIHIESGKLYWRVPECSDVVVIAGDLWNGHLTLSWLEEMAPIIGKPIVYVPGNHCFWDNDLKLWPAYARKFCANIGVHFLYNDVVEIDDTVFLGTTLWTDFNALGNQPLKMIQAQGVMTDYKYIHNGDRLITADDILAEHHQARQFLETQLAHYAGRKRCVVTHHAPTRHSLDAKHAESKYTPFYVNDLQGLMLEHGPDVWVHGHIHSSVQYFVGETMVISNPRGHQDKGPPAWNREFHPERLVEF